MKLFFLTVAALLVFVSHAQTTQQEYLNVHNTARGLVGVANITWSTTAAAFAQTLATQRAPTCSAAPMNGVNIMSGGPSLTGSLAVTAWAVTEQPYYIYATNTCVTGTKCEHYTQVVWSASTGLGCYRVTCTNGNVLVVCSYSPAGNIAGQRPY
ncbi:hypothetical protein MKW94_027094 [Papaver nudicaule]|uniref:SCP domain-containing protein n=1 Tax=Papaver nudicaule TaxID=74823 RepID=A0AA41VEL8_PAPNU|nr:hypothetical protein [Papaver nudicaule]